MSKEDEGNKPPPIDSQTLYEDFQEPEDWDMPPIITDDDECPEILVNVEPEEAIETIFTNIHLSTIISLILGIVLGIALIIIERIFHGTVPPIVTMLLGFSAGILIVFGAAEIIILGAKGMSDKLNWNPYISGIVQAIGAALAELVVVIILLVNSKTENNPALATTAIVLILTTVIINIFFLGVSMIIVSKDEPFKLPHELTIYEANLVLGMIVFSFVIMLYGLYFMFTEDGEIPVYNRFFEIVIGIALVLVYFFFLFILMRKYGKKTSTPQTLISEFFPDEEEIEFVESEAPIAQLRLLSNNGKIKANPQLKNNTKKEEPCETIETKNHRRRFFRNGRRTKRERSDALATLRRFPWIIIIVLFLIGAGGIIWGGEIMASSIESGLELSEDTLPLLVYAVIVGLISSSPELIVTLRGVFSVDKENRQIGLVHQVSAINQTFFLLFGVPFVLSGLAAIGIPISLDITIVMGGIFIIATAEMIMIMDDNHFDLLEGIVITILSIVSLLALALIGGFT
ncbi:MAG TPA: sodium/calcium exchanger protein [candidate division Zixibacteria bacterium]|nr:sodium/calcium exchanger protein [candidate division Zixibacteria bacterium]